MKNVLRIALGLLLVSQGVFAGEEALFLVHEKHPGQDHDKFTSPVDSGSTVDGTRLAIVGAATVSTLAAINLYQANGWWKYNRRSFHFREDLSYGRSIDKLGHFYSAGLLTFVFSKSLQWANVSEPTALIWGASASALFQTYLEVQDGFSAWGFDRVDFAVDIAGAFYPVAQHAVPFLRDFNFKFSYHPSDLLHEAVGTGYLGQQHIVFDDYEGQTLWLSISVNNLLPTFVEESWPDWLALAIGYGARGVAESQPYSIYLISFDYDLTKIIPNDTWFLKTLGETLNFIHFPAPAVRISPGAIWYGLYF